jgi:hypothetical protein
MHGNFVTAVSLLLCVATAGSWIRSEFRLDVLSHYSRFNERRSRTWQQFGCERGSFWYGQGLLQADPKSAPSSPFVGWGMASESARSRGAIAALWCGKGFYLMGFGGWSLRWTVSGPEIREHRAIMVPHWFVMLLLAVAPARWVVLKRRERRNRARGLCSRCGYDLRATPDRCPECGAGAAMANGNL